MNPSVFSPSVRQKVREIHELSLMQTAFDLQVKKAIGNGQSCFTVAPQLALREVCQMKITGTAAELYDDLNVTNDIHNMVRENKLRNENIKFHQSMSPKRMCKKEEKAIKYLLHNKNNMDKLATLQEVRKEIEVDLQDRNISSKAETAVSKIEEQYAMAQDELICSKVEQCPEIAQ